MSSEPFVAVAPVADVQPGRPRIVAVNGTEVAVFNVDGSFYALDNFCPHQGAPLSDGWIEGTTVTCPWHAWCFNLTDGKMTMGFDGVDVYDVKIEDGRLWVSSVPRRDPKPTP